MSGKMPNIIITILVFCGIYEGKVFLQITDRDNNILGNCDWEKEVADNEPITLADAVQDMVIIPEDLKFFTPKGGIHWFHGQKLLKSGTKDIATCEEIINPGVLRILSSYVMDIIEFADYRDYPLQ